MENLINKLQKELKANITTLERGLVVEISHCFTAIISKINNRYNVSIVYYDINLCNRTGITERQVMNTCRKYKTPSMC